MKRSQTSHAGMHAGDGEVELGYLNEAVEMEWKEGAHWVPEVQGNFSVSHYVNETERFD